MNRDDISGFLSVLRGTILISDVGIRTLNFRVEWLNIL